MILKTLKKPAKYNWIKKTIFILSIGLSLTIGCYWFFIKNKSEVLSNLSQQNVLLTQRYNKSRQQLHKSNAIERRIKTLKRKAKYLHKLKSPYALSNLISSLSKACNDNNVTLISAKPLTKKKGKLNTETIQLNLSGEYYKILKLIDTFKSIPWVNFVSALNLKTEKSITVQIILEVCHQ